VQLKSIVPTTEADKTKLYPYSNSRLTAINQCPIYGIVHNQRQYQSTARAMALEAGSTMHEVFAAVRIWQLEHVQQLPKHALHTAHRLFNPDRWRGCVSKAKDQRDNLIDTCFNILHSSGWQDEQSDRIRTMTNMELATIKYCDERLAHMDNWPVWVADKKRPNTAVGIEQPFDITLHFTDGVRFRYIGTIDGLIYNENRKRYEIDENKTASRLDDAWISSFDLAHQVTGYCAASTTVFGFAVLHCRVTGVKIRPSNVGEDIIPIEPLERTAYSINCWGKWVRHTAEMYEQYADEWEEAPRYTHSCNRYFRPCSMIPFCADTPDGRRQQWEQMIDAPPSPSEAAVLDL
jgi:hypothetical protein